MNDTPSQHNVDEHATMRLAQVRDSLAHAVTEFRTDLALYRALNHALGAVEEKLNMPRTIPSRTERRRLR